MATREGPHTGPHGNRVNAVFRFQAHSTRKKKPEQASKAWEGVKVEVKNPREKQCTDPDLQRAAGNEAACRMSQKSAERQATHALRWLPLQLRGGLWSAYLFGEGKWA